jgi:redox-sensitive bicupin YhaK (pirin superfamily)
MTWRDCPDGAARDLDDDRVTLVEPQARDLGGFTVQRILPARGRRMVGPFVFLDDAAVDLAPGSGIDVRPHPHIGLATLSYLLTGSIVHRDSLGSVQTIVPGDINWMVAGRGIAHSERSGDDVRRLGGPVHLLQQWVALPEADEETAPRFEHHAAETLPEADGDGVRLRVLVGSAYGLRAAVTTCSPMCYVDARLEPGAALPLPDEHEERAALVVEGTVAAGGGTAGPGRLLVFGAGPGACLRAEAGPARVVVLGGAPLGPRHLWWNFVSSSQERIEQARADWQAHRFGLVAGDTAERIPLPG